jgi:hypothetical protein
MYYRVLNWMSIDVSKVCAASIIALMMEAACTSETSVNIQLRTRQCIPEDPELQVLHVSKTFLDVKNMSYSNINLKPCLSASELDENSSHTLVFHSVQ